MINSKELCEDECSIERRLSQISKMSTTSQPVSIWLGTENGPLTAKNDGGIVISRDEAWSGDTRYGRIPLGG